MNFQNTKLKIIFSAILFFGFFSLAHGASAKTFYLDGNLSSDCTSGNYSIANRNCTGSDGDAYKLIEDAESHLVGSDILYIREGSYSHAATGTCTAGILNITVAGTSGNPTIVQGYTGEQPIICAYQGHCNYNPDPTSADGSFCTGCGSSKGTGLCYYPNPAISIQNSYTIVKNIKTYGQVIIPYAKGKHDITIEQCDIGGGGPWLDQGMALMINGYDATPGFYNVSIKNNKIHHSVNCGTPINSATLMTYAAGDMIIENNEFSDGYGPDIRIKDGNYQTGKILTIRNNFFKPTTINSNKNFGVLAVSQWDQLDAVYVYNNIFMSKSEGVAYDASNVIAYNNTFVDCDYDFYSSASDLIIEAYNNLQYHTANNKYYIYHENTSVPVVLTSNYNLFYQTGSGNRWKRGALSTSSFPAWQGAGYDINSLNGSNPNFVNPTGSNPEDFKRSSYTENFTGSSYGIHAGAYETGNETIGIDWTTPADVTPPAAPSGLSVQ